MGLFVPRLRSVAIALVVGVLVAPHGGYLPQPFVIGLLPFCGLIVAGVLDAVWSSERLRRRRPWAGPALAAALAGVLVVLLLPAWRHGDAYAMSASETQPVLSAERWIEAHVNRRARVLIDDTMYVDLVRAGFAQRFPAVWFYKLDFTTNLDPSIVRHLPKGWREFDYVVSTPVIR